MKIAYKHQYFFKNAYDSQVESEVCMHWMVTILH